MRPNALRTMLLVLAMVLQTIAGGVGFGRAASMSVERTFGAPCHQVRAGERSAPDNRFDHRRHCQACLICGEPPPGWVSLDSDFVVARGDYALIETPVFAAPSLSDHFSRAHCARAPPLSRA